LQVIEQRAERPRFGLRIDRLTKAFAFGKLGIVLLLDLGELRLQNLESVLFAHRGTTQTTIPPPRKPL
jgi:hypothetical protein